MVMMVEEEEVARSLLPYAVTAGLVCSSSALPRGIPAPPHLPNSLPPSRLRTACFLFFCCCRCLSGNERKRRVAAFRWNDNDRASEQSGFWDSDQWGGAGGMCATVSGGKLLQGQMRIIIIFSSFPFVPRRKRKV